MRKFRLPQCPYCGKKVNPFYAWYRRTQGEYICPRCQGVSNIFIDRAAYLLGGAAVLLGVLAFVITRVVQDQSFHPLHLLWIVLPFFLFSIVSLFLVRLKKPILRRRETPQEPARRASQEEAAGARPAPGEGRHVRR